MANFQLFFFSVQGTGVSPSLVALAFFLPGRGKDLSSLPRVRFIFIQATDFQKVILYCSHVFVNARNISLIFSLIITSVAEMLSYIRLPSAGNMTVRFSAAVQLSSAVSQRGLAVQNAKF